MWNELTIPTVLLNIRRMGAPSPLTRSRTSRWARGASAGPSCFSSSVARRLTAKELAEPAGSLAQRGAAPSQGARGRRGWSVRAACTAAWARRCSPIGSARRGEALFPRRYEAGPHCAAGPGGRARGPRGRGRAARVLFRCALPAGSEATWPAAARTSGSRRSAEVLSEEGYMAEVHGQAGERHADRAQLRHSRRWRSGFPRSARRRRGSSPRCWAPR